MDMQNAFERERQLIGRDAVEQLKKSHVAVFGLGGVGSFCAEALARAAVGKLTLIDHDIIEKTNINRQLHATVNTIGQDKVQVMAQRINEINPDCEVIIKKVFFSAETADEIFNPQWNYIADAIDSVTSKLELAVQAQRLGIPLISCMGTGNKLCPEQFEIADLYQTSVCPLCKVMRKELRARGVDQLTVVYSKEPPRRHGGDDPRTPASISFTPPVAGFIMAGHIIKALIGNIN